MRILIVSSDPASRRALAGSLESILDVEVIGDSAPETALAHVGRRSRPDIAVWDLGDTPGDLARLSGFARLGPNVVALVTSAQRARRARAAGAMAVLPRGVDVAALHASLQAVHEGLSVADPTLEPPLGDTTEIDDLGEELTPRELEVLRLIAEGLSNKAIAARLAIRESTVKDHVNSMLDKLGAQSRTEAVTLALRRGLIAI